MGDQLFWGLITFVLYFNIALGTGRLHPRDSCDDLAPYLASFSSYPQATVASFCSSLLDSPKAPATTTRTITVTRRTSVKQTVTTRKTVTTTTRRSTLTVTELSVVTRTFTSRVPYRNPGAKARRQAAAAPPLEVQNGQVLGKSVSIASQACACMAKRPRVTVTTRTTTFSTVTKQVTTTRTRTTTFTSVPITTVTRTTTRRITSTICIGANPSPSFKLQFQDTGATDQYNNQYLTYAPYPPEDGYDGDEIGGSPTQAGGKIFYTDCIDRLTTAGSFGVLEYLFAITGQDIAPVYLGNQTEILGYGDSAEYLACQPSNGFLDCNARNPLGGSYTILQTTQLYEPLGTTVVIGTRVGSGDSFFPFRWKFFNV